MVTARNYCLTLNNPRDEESAKWSNIGRDIDDGTGTDLRYFVYQKEAGDANTPHLQGYAQFKKRVGLREVKRLFGDRVHAEIARGSSVQNKEYCTKSTGRLEGPYEHGVASKGKGMRTDLQKFVEDAESAELTEDDLIRNYPEIVAKYPRFALRVERYFSTRREPTVFVPQPGWQTELDLYLRTRPDERKVRWYYDPIGNTGKSYFATHYYIDGGGRYERPFIVNNGKWADIFYAYKKEKIIIFDWPRDVQESFPYAVAEMFKNGYFLNTKYESYPVYFETPHVIVMANFQPDMSKLSADRWEIKNI